MKRWVKRAIADHQLSAAEADFVRGIFNSTHGVPRVARRAFVRDTAEMLSGRPSVERPSELVDALGQPVRYANEWLHEEGFDRWVPPWRRWWLQPRSSRVGQLAVLAVLVVGGGMARSYYGATPEIGNSCSGARAPEYETLQAAGHTEYVMPFRVGARFGVSLCPSSIEGVVIERVYLEHPGDISIQPVGFELSPPTAADGVGDASRGGPFTTGDAGWRNLTVWFEGEYCNHYGGGGLGIETLSVDYTYRGRTRTTQVPLLARYSVTFEPDQCNQEDVDATTDRWRQAVEASPFASSASPLLRFAYDGLGPLQLTPESVSRDLCRHLRGITPPGANSYSQFESLEDRAVFQLDRAVAEPLIDGAVLGVCPEFGSQRDELVAMVGERG